MKKVLKNKGKSFKLTTLGFTMVELLGVIIILGVLALITFPIIDKSIKNSKEKALERAIDNIEEAAYKYSITNDIGYETFYKKLSLEELKKAGFLEKDTINPVTNENMTGCVLYKWNKIKKQYEFKYDEECDVSAPTIVFNLVDSNAINGNGWANKDFYVKASIIDNSGSGIKEVKSCTTNSSSECSPVLVANETTKTYLIATEGSNRACIEVTDNNNKTTKVCSDTYNLDKTAPVAGTINFTGTMGSNSWYTSDVTVNIVNGSDVLSGHSSTTSNITSITSNTTGTTVTITTTDLAGNTSSRNYTIKVDKNAPKISSKNGEITITEGDSDSVSDYFAINYSTSGGSVSCTPNSTASLSIGMQKLICNVTGGNGKTATAEKEILVNEFCTTPITVTIGGKTISTTECEIQREDPASDPRYVGLNPKNYVRFNNELWRIIGVFDGEIKIIRNEYYVDLTTGKDLFAWNNTDKLSPYWEGTGYYPSDYDYSTNWSKASLQILLNTTFLNSIDSTSRSYINSSHIWNLGAIEGGGIDYSVTFADVYNMERGTIVNRGMPTTWRGAIALIYPTDLPYASSSRSSDSGVVMINSGMRNHKVNWLYQLIKENGAWTLNSRIDLENPTYYWDEVYAYKHTGAIYPGSNTSTGYSQGGMQYRYGGVLPSLYLKSDVKIKSGTGTENDPYILGL